MVWFQLQMFRIEAEELSKFNGEYERNYGVHGRTCWQKEPQCSQYLTRYQGKFQPPKHKKEFPLSSYYKCQIHRRDRRRDLTWCRDWHYLTL